MYQLFQFFKEQRIAIDSLKIILVQEEIRRTYLLRGRVPVSYIVGDIVAIMRTQLGPGRKIKARFFGPYRIIEIKSKDTSNVTRVGVHEGLLNTSTCAELIKPWANQMKKLTSKKNAF